jgi:hypothetical protein
LNLPAEQLHCGTQRNVGFGVIQQTDAHVLRTTCIGVGHQAGICCVGCAGERDVNFGDWCVGFIARIVQLAVFQIDIYRELARILLALITAVGNSPRSTSLSTLSGAMLQGASITTPLNLILPVP